LKLVSYLGTAKDTADVRNKLHSITDSTLELVKDTTNDLKTLSNYEAADEWKQHQRKIDQQKLSKDFQTVLAEFQKAQRLSATKQRDYVDRAKASNVRNDVDDEDDDTTPLIDDSQRRLRLQVTGHEVEYNEALIAERLTEIRDIETNITELNEIFQEVATLVNVQQNLIDNIESNVHSIAHNVRSGSEQLTNASRYQKAARGKLCYLLLIFVIITSVVALLLVAGR